MKHSKKNKTYNNKTSESYPIKKDKIINILKANIDHIKLQIAAYEDIFNKNNIITKKY